MNAQIVSTGSLVLVDNDHEDALILRSAARRCVYDVPIVHLSAGQEFLAAVRESRLPPRCIILLDLNMPTMDGFAVLEQLRTANEGNLLPVVIYSTSSDQVQINRAYASGANAFFTKPSSMLETIDLMNALIDHWFTFGKTPIPPARAKESS